MSLPLVPAILALALANSVPAPSTGTPQAQPEQSADSMLVQTDSASGVPVCLKLRVYHFQRNDGDAPKLVRETTCTTVRPYLRKTRTPKARLVPAD